MKKVARAIEKRFYDSTSVEKASPVAVFCVSCFSSPSFHVAYIFVRAGLYPHET